MPFGSFYSVLPERPPDLPPSLKVGGHTLVLVPGSAEAPLGNESVLDSVGTPSMEDIAAFPHEEAVLPFYIDVSEVTQRQ